MTFPVLPATILVPSAPAMVCLFPLEPAVLAEEHVLGHNRELIPRNVTELFDRGSTE